MNINVVTVRSGWILQKIAERIVEVGNKEDIATFSLSHTPGIGQDVNFYCDVQNCYMGQTNALDIGFFTHVHENDMGNVRPIVFNLDYIFHMAPRYLKAFAEAGFSEQKMSIMEPWQPDGFSMRKTTIGIFQRGKYRGKGFHRMLEVFDKLNNEVGDYLDFIFIGNDWEEVVKRGRDKGISSIHVGDDLTYPHSYNYYYDKVDYLLIPSEWEGGPICALEAAAKGVPIISSDVGWVSELPRVDLYESTDALVNILLNIAFYKKWNRIHVEQMSYEKCARQIVEVAENYEY